MTRVYFGLGCDNNHAEPSAESGYSRVDAETSVDLDSISLSDLQLVFPESTGSGYGIVTSVMMFDSADAVEARRSWNLPEPADVHAGVTPVIHKGRLIRGIDISAKVQLCSDTMAKA